MRPRRGAAIGRPTGSRSPSARRCDRLAGSSRSRYRDPRSALRVRTRTRAHRPCRAQPSAARGPIGRSETAPVLQRLTASDVELRLVKVDLSVREVGESARVVEIEVGHEDVAHVAGVVPTALTCATAVSAGSSRGSITNRAGPSRDGVAMSLAPNPVSSRISPEESSINKQRATRCPASRSTRPSRGPIRGHIVPQLR